MQRQGHATRARVRLMQAVRLLLILPSLVALSVLFLGGHRGIQQPNLLRAENDGLPATDEYTNALTRQLLLLSDALAAERTRCNVLERRVKELEAVMSEKKKIEDAGAVGNVRLSLPDGNQLEHSVAENLYGTDVESLQSVHEASLEIERQQLMQRNREAMHRLLGNMSLSPAADPNTRQQVIAELFPKKKRRPLYSSILPQYRQKHEEELEYLEKLMIERAPRTQEDNDNNDRDDTKDGSGDIPQGQRRNSEAESCESRGVREEADETICDKRVDQMKDDGNLEVDNDPKPYPEVREASPKVAIATAVVNNKVQSITSSEAVTCQAAPIENDIDAHPYSPEKGQGGGTNHEDCKDDEEVKQTYNEAERLERVLKARQEVDKAAQANSKGSIEKRLDKSDGLVYTKYEFYQRYGSLDQWEAAKPPEEPGADDVSDTEKKNDSSEIPLREVVRWGGQQVKRWLQSVKTTFGITEHSFTTFTQYGVSGDVLLDLTEQDIRDIGLRQTQAKAILRAINSLKDSSGQ